MTAAFLGGIGNPAGALLGGVVLGVLSAFGDFLLSAFWTPVLTLLLLVGLLALPADRAARDQHPASRRASDRRPRCVDRRARSASAAARRRAAGPGCALPAGSGMLFGGVRLYDGDDRPADGGAGARAGAGRRVRGPARSGVRRVLRHRRVHRWRCWRRQQPAGAVVPALSTSRGWPCRWPGCVAAGFGMLFGLPSIRARGEYLAIVTLALGEIVPALVDPLPGADQRGTRHLGDRRRRGCRASRRARR